MEIIRETISKKLLVALEKCAATTIDLIWSVSTTKTESYKRLRLLGYPESSKLPGKKIVEKFKHKHEEYKRYYGLLSNLKSQGLIGASNTAAGKCWAITTKGKNFLSQLKGGYRMESLTAEGGTTIVSYDIPEKLRRERDRIRETLKLIDFTMAHQSLWYSNKRVTKQFIDLLRKRGILDFVHIFEVNKSGTLKKLSDATN